MMPKEKAEELIEKFSPLVTVWDCYYDTPQNPDLIRKDAIKCALVCVGEILKEVESDTSALIVSAPYWNEVKAELITT